MVVCSPSTSQCNTPVAATNHCDALNGSVNSLQKSVECSLSKIEKQLGQASCPPAPCNDSSSLQNLESNLQCSLNNIASLLQSKGAPACPGTHTHTNPVTHKGPVLHYCGVASDCAPCQKNSPVTCLTNKKKIDLDGIKKVNGALFQMCTSSIPLDLDISASALAGSDKIDHGNINIGGTARGSYKWLNQENHKVVRIYKYIDDNIICPDTQSHFRTQLQSLYTNYCNFNSSTSSFISHIITCLVQIFKDCHLLYLLIKNLLMSLMPEKQASAKALELVKSGEINESCSEEPSASIEGTTTPDPCACCEPATCDCVEFIVGLIKDQDAIQDLIVDIANSNGSSAHHLKFIKTVVNQVIEVMVAEMTAQYRVDLSVPIKDTTVANLRLRVKKLCYTIEEVDCQCAEVLTIYAFDSPVEGDCNKAITLSNGQHDEPPPLTAVAADEPLCPPRLEPNILAALQAVAGVQLNQ